jgi:hypothetical protein
MLFEIAIGIEARTGFEHYDAEAAFGEDLGRGAAPSPGADDAHVVDLAGRVDLKHRTSGNVGIGANK